MDECHNMGKGVGILLLTACCLSLHATDAETSILLFGHSYGQDSTEHLPALLDAAGIKTVRIARFVKANCSLEERYNFFAADTTDGDSYSECAPGSTTWQTVSCTVKQAIDARAWDFVIFQNSLENEGRYETAQPYLNDLVAYVRSRSRELHGREPTICWNLFWPISKLAEDGSNATLTYRLSFYGNSSQRMWQEYVRAARQLMADTGITNIVPTGAAIMNLRASPLNTSAMNEFTRDKYHLSLGAGRYAAACTLFEYFVAPKYGVSVLGNPLRLPNLAQPVTDANAETLQRCAVDAVRNPFAHARAGMSMEWIREDESAQGLTGQWMMHPAEYAEGAVAVEGANAYAPDVASGGRYVRLTATMRFGEEWTDADYLGDAKAAVRLGSGGRLQLYTRVAGERTWVDVSGASCETERDYTFSFLLDCTNRTYTAAVTVDGVHCPLCGSTGSVFAFANGDGSPVEKVSFAGLGAVNALRGSYGDKKGGFSLLFR